MLEPHMITGIVIVAIVVGLPIISGTLISLAKIMKGSPSGSGKKGNSQYSREEAEIMQDIHRTLSRLEKRIDSLETIVLEKPMR